MKSLLVASLLVLAGCSEPATPPPGVDTSGMEAAVAELIDSRYRAVASSPDSATAWCDYGIALHGHDLWDEAIVCYERAHRMKPGEFDFPYLLAYARELRGADVEGTLEYLDLAEKIDATYPPFYVQKAWVLSRAGRSEEARDSLLKALALAPDYAAAHGNLGEILLLLGDASGAVTHLEAALETVPDDRSVTAAMARALNLAGDAERAKTYADRVPDLEITMSDGDSILEKVRDINRTASAAFDRAKQYARVGQWEDALTKLRIALPVMEDDHAVHSRMGHALMMLGRNEEALPYLERTIEMKPEHVVARVRRARVLSILGRTKDAENELAATLGMAPTFGEALTLRAIFYLDKGDLGSAEDTFRMAQESPQGITGDGYMRWGLALAQSSRVTEAVGAFEKFVAAQPEHGEGRYMLAIAYEQTDQMEKAIANYRTALELAPNHPLAARARNMIPQR